ncbi:TerC family protein [Laribacter hongkongensis]|uniref:TerC family protein n=1 Tax=Laribacter hongkongensis TaxID=168471 RepID=UPI001EFC562A|nr:TerC family protein [Laribacter hongkongensis]MCG8993923.1 TerC family protein [Laribacter hongkongensis]MCG9009644.1 TerC family protein [Laribacter hongkongensis]MCG9021952.1 TerC family protein [Laribacter hongkongensis]MCG9046764.1 TerC family protein [Laribacter hongkongensis]MCG9073805.1 TerC family protein [Laribacter hongkongensis]
MYAGFFAAVIAMIVIDIIALNKQGSHKVSAREALGWSAIWISIAMLFNLWLWWHIRTNVDSGLDEVARAALADQKALEFLTGYLIEKSLAVDNIFVFLLIFNYFKVPAAYQRRVLVYGVLGAIFMRAIMIALGAVLVAEFSWVLYLFGAFLVFTGIKMMLPEKESADDLGNNRLLKWIRSHMRITTDYHGESFFVRSGGILWATPMFLVLTMIELSDLVFAVDSIPAIFAVTRDPFIVLTSNIFAILGLRAMYFLLADVADRFHLLKYGLAVVLTFIGVKMLLLDIYHIPTVISLTTVFAVLVTSIILSLLTSRDKK